MEETSKILSEIKWRLKFYKISMTLFFKPDRTKPPFKMFATIPQNIIKHNYNLIKHEIIKQNVIYLNDAYSFASLYKCIFWDYHQDHNRFFTLISAQRTQFNSLLEDIQENNNKFAKTAANGPSLDWTTLSNLLPTLFLVINRLSVSFINFNYCFSTSTSLGFYSNKLNQCHDNRSYQRMGY